MSTTTQSIPDRSSPGSPRAAPTAGYQGGGDKFATDTTKNSLRSRNNITIGTWNVRSLNKTGSLEQLTYEMSKYNWNILGICEMRWKNFGEMNTEEGHKLLFSGKVDKHEHGVGFLVHKDTVKSVMGCEPISSRLIKIRLRAKPFNITIIQAYAPTTDHSADDVENFYDQVQEIIDQVHKKDIVIVQGDWNSKIGKDAYENWKDTIGISCNDSTNERGLRLLEFANFNNLVAANTLGHHKKSRRMTWHSPGELYHNQIDYILVQRRFKSSIKI